jgi:rSAM/selenodomain-associated transferase 1
MADSALVVMARYPQVGTTKTRLARTIGDEEAVRLYRAFLSDLAQRFSGQICDLHWAYSPGGVDYPSFMATLVPSLIHHMHSFPQRGADLGARLHQAFRWTYEQGYQRTIVIGSDTPHISLDIVARAREALDIADVVLGPADDGGYYLIAMRKPHDVFRNIPMSTNMVMQLTTDLACRQGLKVYTLENLFDVDELPDLLRLAELLQANSSLAPATAACLESIKELV